MAQRAITQYRRASDDAAKIVREMFDAFNERDLERAVKNVAPEAQFFSIPEGSSYAGPNGMQAYYEHWIRAFPDGVVAITNLVAGADMVAIEYTGRGTHRGPLPTATGEVAATNRPVELYLCDVLQFRDGLLIRGRTYFDSLSLWRQLGLAR